jgi:hypothetical protein
MYNDSIVLLRKIERKKKSHQSHSVISYLDFHKTNVERACLLICNFGHLTIVI